MPARKLIAALCALIIVLLTGCATDRSRPRASPPTVSRQAMATAAQLSDAVRYHWVQVVSRSAIGSTATDRFEPVLLARAVVDNQDRTARCPMIETDTGSATMVPRDTGASAEAFPILVCEARVPTSASQVRIGGEALGFSPRELGAYLRQVVLIGDTGCKGTDDAGCPTDKNDYSGKKGWGFPLVVDAIATRAKTHRPSLFVHVGDFLYRRPTDEQVEKLGCVDGKPCDIWDTWAGDYFAPAAGLLGQAPWLLARGNHEMCTSNPRVEGGEGWFLLLSPVTPCMDPGEELPGCSQSIVRQCTSGHEQGLRTCSSCDAEFPQPWAVDLSLPSSPSPGTIRTVVMDTSAGKDPDPPEVPPADVAAMYHGQYRDIARMLEDVARAWMVTHVPIYAITSYDEKSDPPFVTVNRSLQTASQDPGLARALELVLVGHRHILQSVNVTEIETGAAFVPPHLLMGASGVALSGKKLSKALDDGVFDGATAVGREGKGRATVSGWLRRYHSFAEIQPGSGEIAWTADIFEAKGNQQTAACAVAPATGGWPTAITCVEKDAGGQ